MIGNLDFQGSHEPLREHNSLVTDTDPNNNDSSLTPGKKQQAIQQNTRKRFQKTGILSALTLALGLNACIAPQNKNTIPTSIQLTDQTALTHSNTPNTLTLSPGKPISDIEKQSNNETAEALKLLHQISTQTTEQIQQQLPEIMQQAKKIIDSGSLYLFAVMGIILLGNNKKIPSEASTELIQKVFQNEIMILKKQFEDFAENLAADIASHPEKTTKSQNGKPGKKSRNRRIAELTRLSSRFFDNIEFDEMIGNYNQALFNAILPYVLVSQFFKKEILPKYKHDNMASFLDFFRDFSTTPSRAWQAQEKRPAKCHTLTVLASIFLPTAKKTLLKRNLITEKPGKMGTSKEDNSLTGNQAIQLAPGFASATEHIFLAVSLNGHSPNPKKPSIFYFEPTLGQITPWQNLNKDMDQNTKPRPMEHLIGSIFNEIAGTHLLPLVTTPSLSNEEKDKLIQQSIKYYKIATILDSNNHISWINLGTSQVYGNQYEKAAEAYKKALSINSKDYPIPEYGLAQIEYLKKNFDQAKTLCIHLINRIEKDLKNRAHRATILTPTFKKARINSYILFIKILIAQKSYAAAKTNLRKLKRICSGHPQITSLESSLSQAVCEEKTIALENEARSFFNQQNYAKALEKYLVLHKQHPSIYSYTFNIGNCYEMLNNLTQAIEYYKKAYQIKPKKNISDSYERCQRILATHNYNQAINIYNTKYLTAKTQQEKKRCKQRIIDLMKKSLLLLNQCNDPRCQKIMQYIKQLAQDCGEKI